MRKPTRAADKPITLQFLTEERFVAAGSPHWDTIKGWQRRRLVKMRWPEGSQAGCYVSLTEAGVAEARKVAA